MTDSDAPAPKIAAPEAGRTVGDAFASLVELMRLLRSPDGCPWDREQTLDSLKRYVLEEAHEVVDAIERGDLDELRGEIGDLVFEGVFLAQLCADAGHFTMIDALHDIRAKLVRRHPHVFAPDGETAHVTTPDAVKVQWDEIKAAERAGKGRERTGFFDGIPVSLPALMRAHQISVRAGGVGFDWTSPQQVAAKVEEELGELTAAIDEGDAAKTEEELGDLLFAAANLARKLAIDPEAALRAANRKFTRRFEAMQALLAEGGVALADATLDRMEAAWQQVKTQEKPEHP